jgi:Uma2 family endonuclease
MARMESPAVDPNRRYTLEEYFQLEAESPYKWEFRDGEVVCMAGSTPMHGLITMNAGGELRQLLKGTPCRAYSESTRVRLVRRTKYGHPDVTIICGEPELDPEDQRGETVVNPRLVVEVLSPSTELYDRTTKFRYLMTRESFQEYLLISQFEPRLEVMYRHPDGVWRMRFATGLDQSVRLESIGVDLPLAEVYAGVTFPPAPPDHAD